MLSFNSVALIDHPPTVVNILGDLFLILLTCYCLYYNNSEPYHNSASNSTPPHALDVPLTPHSQLANVSDRSSRLASRRSQPQPSSPRCIRLLQCGLHACLSGRFTARPPSSRIRSIRTRPHLFKDGSRRMPKGHRYPNRGNHKHGEVAFTVRRAYRRDQAQV